MAIRTENELSPREWAIYNNEREMWQLQADHQSRMKDKDIEVQKLEAKWASWVKLPVVLLTLPVRVLLVIPLTVYAITHQEVPEFYQRFFR